VSIVAKTQAVALVWVGPVKTGFVHAIQVEWASIVSVWTHSVRILASMNEQVSTLDIDSFGFA